MSRIKSPGLVSEIEREHHDNYAKKFNEKKLVQHFRDAMRDPLWTEILPWLKGRSVLEIGCGLGFDTVTLARLGFVVHAIDISKTSLEQARVLADLAQVGESCEFEVVDLNVSDVAGRFDMVYGRAVLHHLTVKPLWATLEMLRSVLSEGGRMVFLEPLDRNPIVELNRKVLDVYDRTPTEKPLNLRAVMSAMERASLRITHSKEYYLTATLAHVFNNVVKSPRLFRPSQGTLNRIDFGLMNTFWPLKEYAWLALLVAEPKLGLSPP